MLLSFWSVGKSHEAYVKTGVEDFTKRINHYYKAEWQIIPPVKQTNGLTEVIYKKKEAEIVLNRLEQNDHLILLDERGKLLKSEELANQLELKATESIRKIVFLIGGAYGVDESINKRANFVWSLSPLVFPHQLVRLILAEQVYRACTIIRNEKYHHQ